MWISILSMMMRMMMMIIIIKYELIEISLLSLLPGLFYFTWLIFLLSNYLFFCARFQLEKLLFGRYKRKQNSKVIYFILNIEINKVKFSKRFFWLQNFVVFFKKKGFDTIYSYDTVIIEDRKFYIMIFRYWFPIQTE